jgi:hypothetical protein
MIENTTYPKNGALFLYKLRPAAIPVNTAIIAVSKAIVNIVPKGIFMACLLKERF